MLVFPVILCSVIVSALAAESSPPCVMKKMRAPPKDCKYDIQRDERGCYLSHKTICTGPCRMVKMRAPPKGCEYEIERDQRGCYLSHQTICTGPCKMVRLAAPPKGCKYEIENDQRGCYLSHETVCKTKNDPPDCPNPMPPMAPPPDGCDYDIKYDDQGCYQSHRLVCEPSDPVCKEPKMIGPCRAFFRRFYFDSEEGKCKMFGFGGCGGNGNNFKTKQSCQSKCHSSGPMFVKDKEEPGSKTDVCVQPKKIGRCKARMPRWHYNMDSKKCEKFFYGGCDGNGNRFNNKNDCMSTCSPCKQPKKVGPCEALIPSWYFDSTAKTCRSFNYGGCEGNDNRFKSEAKCRKICA